MSIKTKLTRVSRVSLALLFSSSIVYALDGKVEFTQVDVNINSKYKAIEYSSAKDILDKDMFEGAKKFDMPKNCVTNDKASIARGEYIFHNLNGKKAKAKAPYGLSKKMANGKPKQFGNCVACHKIENAKGYGNIGPDLTNYKSFYIDSGVRTKEFVYQKIADPRVDNKNTHMTINLTNGLMNEQEVCDLASYIISKK